MHDHELHGSDDMFLQFVNRKKDLLKPPPGSRFDKYNSFVKERLAFNLQPKITMLEPYVKDFMKFSDPMNVNVPQLSSAIKEIKSIIFRDQRVAEVAFEPVVLERIVKILREIDNKSIKFAATYILAFSRLDKCDAVIINDAIQYLVDLMHHNRDTALRVRFT
ncbi:uncharacterized protein LOC141692123 [Apium graveolens]|uniref:uncharacterized protein LOC141692123 n=1 Tax=Apium graveolens TaxID=4045 RepID=UPI003D7AEE79